MLDTLKLARRLEAGGMERAQAEALSGALSEGLAESQVTKADLEAAMGTLRAEMKQLDTSLRGEIRQLDASLRGEIAQLDGSLRGEIKQLDSTLRGEIAQLDTRVRAELRTVQWMLGTVLLVTLGVLWRTW